MELEALVLDLEELARRMREDPLFPWRHGDAELVERINESSRAVGLAEPVGFDFDRDGGVARFAVRNPEQRVESSSAWTVPRRRTLPRGDLCFDYHAAPLAARGEYAAIVARWIHHVRSTLREPVSIAPRFPEPTGVLSPNADCLREILRASYPVGVQGPELLKRMKERSLPIDEYALKRIKKELAAKGCPIGNERGAGYFLVPLP